MVSRRRLWGALLVALLLAIPAVALAVEDTTPPELVMFTMDPEIVRTADADQYITVTVHVKDDLSGFDYASFSFWNAHAQEGFGVTVNSWSTPVAGTLNDGVFKNSDRLRQYSRTGYHHLTAVRLSDNVSNYVTYQLSDGTMPGWAHGGFWNAEQVDHVYVPLMLR